MISRVRSHTDTLRHVLALGLVVGAGTYAASADAYCRATTTDCDPSTQQCNVDQHNCLVTGAPLWWAGGAVQLNVDAAGSPALGLTGNDVRDAVQTALSAWANANCPGGGHPDLHLAMPVVEAGLAPAFIPGGVNSSVVVFYDEKWPLPQTTIAKTALGFDSTTGEMLDADQVYNSEDYTFVVDPPASGAETDLVAVLTHEIGHVLGLGHTDVPHATMQPEVQGFATSELRTLEPDDMAGICAIYPPGHAPAPVAPVSSSDEPVASPSCAVARGRGTRAPWALLAAATITLARARRHRRPA